MTDEEQGGARPVGRWGWGVGIALGTGTGFALGMGVGIALGAAFGDLRAGVVFGAVGGVVCAFAFVPVFAMAFRARPEGETDKSAR